MILNISFFFFFFHVAVTQRFACQSPTVATDRRPGDTAGRQVFRDDAGHTHTPLVVEAQRKGETAVLVQGAQASQANNRFRGRSGRSVRRLLCRPHGSRPDHREPSVDIVHTTANGGAGEFDCQRTVERQQRGRVPVVSPVLQTGNVHSHASDQCE